VPALPGKTARAPFGQRLHAHRLAAGLTRADVAWLADVILIVVHNAEQGTAGPGGRDAPGRVARVLGLAEAPSVGVLRWPWFGVRALRVLRVLHILAEAGPRGVAADRLAALCGIRRTKAVPALTKAVPALTKAGLIAGTTGPGNGYRLARSAKDINMFDVVEAVGWSVRLELPPVPVRGGDELQRRLQAVCEEAAEAGGAVLRTVTLADLHDRE
jgi:DNA-binding IscR family transcriptional regulator